MTNIDTILGDSKLHGEVIERHITDLLNVYYATANDPDTAIKVAVLRHLKKRNIELEEALAEVYENVGKLGRLL